MGSLSFKNEKALQQFRNNSKSVVTTLHTRTCGFCGKRKDNSGSTMVAVAGSSKKLFKCKSCTEIGIERKEK